MPRGNPDNLVPNSERSPEELRAMTQKGGKASGAKRRKIKAAKEYMKMLIGLPLDETQQNLAAYMSKAGIEEKDQNQLSLMLMSLMKQAQKGNIKSAELVLSLLGEMPASKTEITGADGEALMPVGLNIVFTGEAGAGDGEASTDG